MDGGFALEELLLGHVGPEGDDCVNGGRIYDE